MFHFKSWISLCIVVFSLNAAAEDLGKRSERRESKRWTLQEWLEQKDRNKMMDMWLSMNAPSPYEAVLGGSHNSSEKYTSYSGTFSAYAQFVGLTAEYENNTEEGLSDLSGLFNVRLIGHTIQGSFLTLHYGQRTRNINAGNVRLNQQFGQASLQLYLITNFGVDGSFRYYLPTSEATLGEVTGTNSEAGAFIDFKNFRIFGGWFKEVQTNKLNNVETSASRTGIRTGLKVFF